MTMTEKKETVQSPCNCADTERAWELMTADKDKTWVAVQISPASRVAIGEWFGMASGEDCIGKVVSVLKGIGADVVVDTAVSEDAVALAEAELVRARKARGERFPLLSARCAAFVRFARENYPEVEIADIPTIGSTNAAVLKEIYHTQTEKKNVYVISVEPCKAAKNTENVDLVLTTEELVRILDETGVNLRVSRKGVLDAPFGLSSGSGYLCSRSGGSAEAVVRCLLTDKSDAAIRKLSYSGLYGEKSRREVTIRDGETEWHIAVVNGADEAESLLQEIREGNACFDYVEVTACTGGCICGDGQNRRSCTEEESAIRAEKLRGVGLKALDEKRAVKSADLSASALAIGKFWTAAQHRKALEELEAEARETVRDAVVETTSDELDSVDVKEENEPLKITIGVDSGAEEDDGEDFEIEFITQEKFDGIGADEASEEPESTSSSSTEDELSEQTEVLLTTENTETTSEEESLENLPVAESEEPTIENSEEASEPIEEQTETTVNETLEEEIAVMTEEASAEKVEENEQPQSVHTETKPYRERLSGKDRRKMKRKNKGK